MIKNENLPPLSVAVINYNGKDVIENTLSHIFASDYPQIEVMVIDDVSTDDSLAIVRSKFPDVRVFEQPRNMGPNAARNKGLIEAKHDIVFIADNDVELAPDCLKLLVTEMLKDDNNAVTTPMVLDFYERDKIYSNGAALHYACFGVIPDRHKKLTADTPLETFRNVCGSGGIMLTRKSAANEIGRFDEDFIFGYDDGEFTYRISMAGHNVVQVPRAKLYHIEKPGRTLTRLRFQIRGRWDLILKSYAGRTLVLLAPALLFFETANFAFLVMKGAAGEWFRGAGLTIGSLGRIMKKRKAVQAAKKIPDNQLLCAGEIYMFPSRLGGGIMTLAKNVFETVLNLYWALTSWALTK